MAITALLAAVDRTSTYLDRMLADAARRDEAGKFRKRKQGELAPAQTDQQPRARGDRPPQALPRPPALPVPSDGPTEHDSRVPPGQPSSTTPGHTGEATPYQILRAQQILEKLMPFLDQQAAATLSEAHALLFGWITALWGRPILLVDTEGADPSGKTCLWRSPRKLTTHCNQHRLSGRRALPESRPKAYTCWQDKLPAEGDACMHSSPTTTR